MRFEIAVIGTSLGGLQALEVILPGLPKSLPIAIAIAQHRHKTSDGELIDYLRQQSLLPVVEAEDKQPIVAGKVYLAPADYHLLVEPGHFALSTEAPVSYARPSIDVLFETTADAYGERVIGIILTGASDDGAQGLRKIKAYGGLAIVQEPATAVSRTMPDAAIAAVNAAKIIPMFQIPPFLVNLCSSSSLGINCYYNSSEG
ncbi:MAG: chemotaxis protein CheB [Heteroscytonema crispum UTEX LB 1556]